MNNKPCCNPQSNSPSVNTSQVEITTRTDRKFELCEIPGGMATVGTDQPLISIDEEGPARTIEIQPFKMMATTVTNEMFEKFIADTGFVTEAERFGWSFVFYQHLPEAFKDTQAVVGSQWWRKVEGANWRHINGPGSDSCYEPEHPVVHVSWNDAQAFAQWAGGALPTESQWEHAARGGMGDVKFPWGDKEPNDTEHQPCNIWQGDFPTTNSCADGYSATAPARSFEKNGYGLYNMCGNVWEWTSGRLKIQGRSEESRQYAKHYKGSKLLKGGSFLCHKSYCFRYRIAARSGNTPDSTTAHQGFRLVF